METQPYSRFNQTDSVLFDGNETYGRWNNPISTAIYNNLILIVIDTRYAGRPDLIAKKLYGDDSLDWMLIAVNNVTDVLNWPSAGAMIKVPDPKLVTSELI